MRRPCGWSCRPTAWPACGRTTPSARVTSSRPETSRRRWARPPRSATTGCSGRRAGAWRRRPSLTAHRSSGCAGSRAASSPATCGGATHSRGRSDKIGGMIVLGITETHCATAAILRDGAIVGCASEERFTRLKNDAGYPRLAVDALLRELALSPRDIDLVALAGTRAYAREWMNRVLHDIEYARAYYGVRLDEPARGLGRRARKLGARLGLAERSRGKFDLSERDRLALVTEHLGIDLSRITTFDHHLCHAAAAYYGSPFTGERALVLTNDNAGDGLCATASTGRETALVRHEAVPSAAGSLGSFYSFVTLLLGMKFGEHEYKVMGLAPYAPASQAERAHEALRAVFGLEATTPARFVWKRRGPRYRLLLESTLGQRFDAIAAGAQRIVEESLLAWARLMRERH